MPIIQDIRTALQEAIEAAGVDAVAADTQVSPISKSATIDARVSFADCNELARTSTRVLEQYVYNIQITCPNRKNSQSDHDEVHATVQAVRDRVLSFSMDGARTEQLISTKPLNFEAALQGQFEYKFAVDLDVIRDIGTGTPPTVTDTGDATPVMTATREALWHAIDNWPAFSDPTTWVRKFKSAADLEELSLHDPAVSELPAIAVTWGPTDPQWWVNTMQQWSQQLFVTFYLPAEWRDVAEWRLVQLMQAFYQCGSTPGVSYIRQATGRLPTKSPISLELVAIGRAQKLHVWQGQIALTLPINFDPNE